MHASIISTHVCAAIVDGQPKALLALVWSIIYRYFVENVDINGAVTLAYPCHLTLACRQDIARWAAAVVPGCAGELRRRPHRGSPCKVWPIACRSDSSSPPCSFADGLAYTAIIHAYFPDVVDMSRLSKDDVRGNLRAARHALHQLGLPADMVPGALSRITRA